MLGKLQTRLALALKEINRTLGFSQAKARDQDLEQAKVRVVIGSVAFLYTVWLIAGDPFDPGRQAAFVAAGFVAGSGAWMIWWFRRHATRPDAMRYFGICADLIPLTIGILGAGEHGVPVIWIYLWVTVGNGFRFGPRYLLFAYWLSLACFATIMFFGPFWEAHAYIGVGFMAILASIPPYFLLLLSRITAQKDEALQLSNAKSRFVANVSHELRTPLTGVVAVYDLLRQRRLPPDERELLGSMGSAIFALKSSVDAVLQMSKLEAGAEHADRKPFNLRYFLSQLNVLVRPQAAAKQISWALNVEPDVPATVVGDVNHLQHVLGNLLNNAFKFTAEGSVSVRVSRAESRVRFEVCDTGIGIPLEKQETLFDRFVQVDDGERRKFGGTGLGTSIAHDLVKLMGGDIGVVSAPGQGAAFWVELPLPGPESGPGSNDFGARNSVLVIGHPSTARDDVAGAVANANLRPVVETPQTASESTFSPQDYLGALLVMSAPDAAHYADTVLRDRAGTICPWLIVTEATTPAQQSMLLKSGASGFLSPALRNEDWQWHLHALANRIDLPAGQAERPPLVVATRKLRILLADDHQSNQMLLARILRDVGHDVVTVGRGDEAFDAMAEGKLDLAILDLNMPDMSGPDVIKLFRAGESGTGERLPIIVLSADATPAARKRSLDAGANGYLTKPVAADHLQATIELIVAGARQRAVESGLAPSAPAAPHLDAARAEHRAASSSTPYVDMQRIESLRNIGQGEANWLKNYLDAAFADVDDALRELKSAVLAKNVRAARDALHKIEGTGASIGAPALLAGTRMMRDHLLDHGQDDDQRHAVAELASICALTKGAVSALLHRGVPSTH